MNLFSVSCEGLKCTPLKAISGIRCPEVADYSSTGEIFLLRCDNQEETASIKLIVMTLLKWNAVKHSKNSQIIMLYT